MEIKIIYQEIEELKKRIYALKEHFQEQIITKEDKIEGKGLSTNDYTDSEKQDNTDNTTARHTHSNKALLDSYTQTEEDIADSVTKKHSHSNKTILDNTTAIFTSAFETKLNDIDANNLIYHADLLTKIYPVGSIYMSVVNTSPQSFLGGIWVAIEDKFLLSKGTIYSAGTTGGSATHTLTTNEMPTHTHTQNNHTHTQNSHNHTINSTEGSFSIQPFWYGDSSRRIIKNCSGFVVDNGDYGSGSTYSIEDSGTQRQPQKVTVTHAHTAVQATAINQNTTATNQNSGGGESHNNMPPYLVVYMWKRTA